MSSTASVSTPSSSSGAQGHVFTEMDCSLFRILKIVNDVVTQVLCFILYWATKDDKDQDMTYWDYLTTVKGLSCTKLKNACNIDATMKHTLKTKKPEEYDASLLCACIRCVFYNDNDAQDLLDSLKKVKDFRNEIIHQGLSDSASLRPKANEIEVLLKCLIEKAKIAVDIRDDRIEDLTKKMTENINKICSEWFPNSEMANYLLLEKLRSKGLRRLRATYENLTYVTPLHYLYDNTSLRVSMVYIQLEMVADDRHTSGQQVNHNDLFSKTFYNWPGGNPSKKAKVILVEGPAGSGKTTLTRLLINNWREGDSDIKGLLDFEFLLFMECRAPHIGKFTELLEILFEEVAQSYTGEEMLKCLRKEKVLVIVDGLDEVNSNSRNLFLEILNNTWSSNFYVLVTTRPEKVEHCYDLCPETTGIAKIRILGIPENKREEFAIKYQDEICKTPNDSDRLVLYLRKMSVNFTDYWRIPNNLCKLVIVWTLWPDTLDGVTTATELLKVTEELLTQSIKKRVSQKPECNDLCPEEITRRIDDVFRPKMYEKAFYGQREGLSLSNESERELTALCEDLKLPYREVLGGFFAQRAMWTRTGTLTKYSYTHKGNRDFYAALHILHNLQREGASSRRSIRDMLGEQHLKEFREVLKHLIGLLYTEGEIIRNEEASEEVVQLLKESGVRDKEAWLDILSNVKANDVIAKLVSEYVPDVMHLKGCIDIKDSNVAVYAKLLKTANPKKVRVKIGNNPSSVPGLQDLLQTMCYLNSEVEVCFQKDFLEPRTATSVTDNPLRTLFERGTIKIFTGCAQGEVLGGLPESIAMLHVSVADSKQMGCLISTVGRLKQLESLCIHAAAGVDVRSQPALSNVDHILYEAEEGDITLLLMRKTGEVPLDKPHVKESKLLYQERDENFKLHVDEKFLLAFEMSHLYAVLNVLGASTELDENLEVHFYYEPTQRQHSNSAGNGNRSVSGVSGVSARYSFRMDVWLSDKDIGQISGIDWFIPGDPEEIPRLKELIVATAGKTKVLHLLHDFRYPRDGGSILDGFLKEEFQSGRLQVTKFRGQLSGSAWAVLPSSLEQLHLAVKDDDHYRELLPALSSLQERLPQLEFLGLHVPTSLDAALLRPLPNVYYLSLWVSGVKEATVEEASRVVAALQPSLGYSWLLFPGACEEEEALARLVEQLGREGVRIRRLGGVVASPRIDGGRKGRLRDLVRREFGCGFLMWDKEWNWRFSIRRAQRPRQPREGGQC